MALSASLLYLSQALSLTLYSFGLAESIRIVWPDAPVQLLAAAIVILVVLAVKSTVLALRMQLPIMVLIGVSIGALVSGTDFGGMQVPMFASEGSAGFWEVFGSLLPSGDGYPLWPRPQR